MNLILVLPATSGATPSTLPPALARLAAYASPTLDQRGLLHAVLEALDAPGAAPAPLLALGAGALPFTAHAYVIAATPLHLAIHGDDVRVAGRATGLPADYAARAMALLNATFADDGFRFVAPRSDAWFARIPRAPDVITAAVDALLGQSLYACRPQGGDARLWERYGNEVQMLLFGLNDSTGLRVEQREATASEPVTRPPDGVWFWGGGALPDPSAWGGTRAFAAHDDTSDAADLARGVMLSSGRRCDAPPAGFAGLPATPIDQKTLLVVPDASESMLATNWLAPVLKALEAGALERLTILAGAAPTGAWSATAPSWIDRLRARITGAGKSRPGPAGSGPPPRPLRPPRAPPPAAR